MYSLDCMWASCSTRKQKDTTASEYCTVWKKKKEWGEDHMILGTISHYEKNLPRNIFKRKPSVSTVALVCSSWNEWLHSIEDILVTGSFVWAIPCANINRKIYKIMHLLPSLWQSGPYFGELFIWKRLKLWVWPEAPSLLLVWVQHRLGAGIR